jgi:hypothetical protein
MTAPRYAGPERRSYDARRRWVVGYLVLTAFAAVGLWRTEENRRADFDRVEQVAQLTRDLRDASRQACESNNDVRANQHDGIQEQIDSTQVALDDPEGLGSLEDFREELEAQQRQRRMRVERLTLDPDAPRQRERPWLTDCEGAHP